jgi:hypothetical protein
MVIEFRRDRALENSCQEIRNAVIEVLDRINPTFRASDPLLSSQSFMVPLFLAFRELAAGDDFSRGEFERFKEVLGTNRRVAEQSLSDASLDFLEYDRMSQQGTNDASSIGRRAEILHAFLLGELVAQAGRVIAAYERIVLNVNDAGGDSELLELA